MNSSGTSLFKETTSDLNLAWRELISFYSIGDTRAGYLRAFELCLSQNCPGMMIWQFGEYKDLQNITPMPDNPRIRLAPGAFYNYLMVYEQIERKVGLIDKAPLENHVETNDIQMFDLRLS